MKKTLLIIPILLICLLPLASAVWIHGYPSHYYRFDNTNIDDNSSQSYNLSYNLADTFNTGKIGSSMNVSATAQNHRLNTSITSNLMNDTYTIDLWIKPEIVAGTTFFFSLASGTNYQPNSLYCGQDAGKLYCASYLANTLIFEKTGTTVMTANTWYHVVYLFGAGGWQMYLNGRIENNHASTAVWKGPDSLVVGARYDRITWFSGLVDNLAMFTYRFNASQINDSYNSGSGTNFTVPAAPAPSGNINDTLNISISYPANFTMLNLLPVSIQISVNTSSAYNCTAYINNSYHNIKLVSDYNTSDNYLGGAWYDFGNLFDSDDTTSSRYLTDGACGYALLNLSLFYIGGTDNLITLHDGAGTASYKIPAQCLLRNKTYIALYIESCYIGIQGANWSCLNGSDYPTLLRTNAGGFPENNARIYSYNLTQSISNNNSQAGNFIIPFNFSFPSTTQSTYDVYFNCTNANVSKISQTYRYFVDLVTPDIYTTFDLNDSFGIEYLSGHANFTDPNLFGFNVSIDGIIRYNMTGLNRSSYVYNLTYNISNLSTGYHNITFCGTDGHTAKQINDYSVSQDATKKNLKFSFDKEYIDIKPEVYEEVNSFTSKKEYDRYSFTFKTKIKEGKDRGFIITSTKKIYIVPSSEYAGWIVIPELNKWVDFETKKKLNVQVSRIDDYNIYILVSGGDGTDITFNSIGDLNTVCLTKTFDKLNVTSSIVTEGTEGTNATLSITIDGAGTYSYNVNLTFNGTTYSTTQAGETFTRIITIPTATEDYSTTNYYFNYTINTSKTLSNSSANTSFIKYKIVLGSCGSNYNTTSLNFSFYDEDNTSQPSAASMNGLLTIQKNSIVRNYSFLLDPAAFNQKICLFPSYENYSLSGYLDYYNGSSAIKRWNANGSANNITNNIPLYVQMNLSAYPIIMTVIDNDGFPIPGVRIKIERWYSGSASYVQVNDLTTDFMGETRFFVTLYTVEYRFIFEYPSGTVVDITPKAYINKQTLEYQLFIGTSPLDQLFGENGISGNVTISNATSSCDFYYRDIYSSITNACATLRIVSGIQTTIINQTCQSATTGHIQINITGISGVTYTCDGSVFYPNKEVSVGHDIYKFNDTTQPDFSTLGMFIALLLTIVVVFALGKNLKMLIIAAPLPFLLLSVLGIIKYIHWSVFLALEIGAFILAGFIKSDVEGLE